MNEDVFNNSMQKFLKRVGVTAQREMERTVREAVSNGLVKGDEKMSAKMVLSLDRVGLSLEINGEIELE